MQRFSYEQMHRPYTYIIHLLLKTVLLSALLHSVSIRAQQLQATLSHYSTDDGLPSNAVADIRQDSYGYLWIATWNGLARFDGFSFLNYNTGVDSNMPFMHNRILDITFDKAQNVWLRMYDGRIFVLNRKTERIENPIENRFDNRETMTDIPLCCADDGSILAFVPDKGLLKMWLDSRGYQAEMVRMNAKATCMDTGKNGTVWIGTQDGLFKLSGKHYEKTQKAETTGRVICICTSDNGVFAGTFGGEIVALDHNGKRLKTWNIGAKVGSLFADSRGNLWFSVDDSGVRRLDMATGEVKTYRHEVSVPKDDAMKAVVSEVDGIVWVRMNRGGFGYYNRAADRVEYFYNDPSTAWCLSNAVGCFNVSPEGIVWESTSRHGLERLEIIKPTIALIKPFGTQEKRYVNNIRAIHYDTHNRMLMVGSKNSELLITDRNGLQTMLQTDDKGEPLGRIYDITQDNSDNYWISTKGDGLLKMTRNGNGYSFTRYRHSAANRQSISSDNVYCTVVDDNGNLWVATYDGGVNILTRRKDGKEVFINTNNALRHYPKGAYMKARTLTKDKEGNVWVGTTDGLLVMSCRNGVVKAEKASGMYTGANGLRSLDIVCLACAPDGTVWVGTNGGGLSRCTGRNANGKWTFETLKAKTGIPSDEVKSITFDRRGNVWFATDHTICSFDKRKHIVSSFGIQDGVDDTTCSEGCAVALPNGKLLFGTINGYYIVDMKRIGSQAKSGLRLTITDFWLDGERTPLYCGTGNGLPDEMTVTLPHHGSSVEFCFASLNHKLQRRVHYQYLLEGHDKHWRDADETRTAAYSSLPAGTYTLRIRAFILESPDSSDQCSVVIHVPPHFLLSAKAVWIYIVMIVLTAILLLHIRQKRLARLAKMRVLKIGPQEIAFAQKADYDFVKQQLDWLENHFSDSSLKVEDLVAVSKMSRTSYYNELKSLTGLSPKELVSDFRLKKAKMMLEKTDTTVAEIAYKTGFNDPVYFTRLFRTTFGMTPTQYRKESNGQETTEKP